MAYDTLCRRSELSAFEVADLDAASNSILVRRSKTDQEGQGSIRFVGPDTLSFLQAWLFAAHITEGAMFQGIDNAEQLTGRLSPEGINRTFKRVAKRLGLAVSAFSSHSCRVGAAQDMTTAGLDIGGIMQAGGWKSPSMVARYTERAAVQRGAAAKLAVLQDRL